MKVKKGSRNIIYIACAVGLAAAGLLYPSWRAEEGWAVQNVLMAKGVSKNETVLDDDDNVENVAIKANVLFLLDTGSAMAFTPNGKLPEIFKLPPESPMTPTTSNLEERQKLAAAYMKECTYGDGSGITQYNGSNYSTSSNGVARRYGRDLDASNNWKAGDTWSMHEDNYYMPFENQPYRLVFKNSSHWTTPPPAGGTNYSADPNNGNLVPNDSRMYKMKLVMWRLLNDATLFENLRIGMATTFQEHNKVGSGYIADFYKNYPFGAGITNNTHGTNVSYPHGSGPIWSTGLGAGPSGTTSQYNAEGAYYTKNASYGYNDSVSCFWGIDRDYYDITNHNAAQWILVNRAYLRVPINDYANSVKLFRIWMNGLEDVSAGGNSDPYIFKDPELTADGKTYLSTAIYPGHPDLSRQKLANFTNTNNPQGGIVLSHSTSNTTVKVSSTNTQSVLKAGTGEALGTVLDFFSPPVSGIGGVSFTAGNASKAPAVSFPLRDPCEKNWVVIFTAGDDSGSYSSAAAVADLYNHTKNNKLTKLKTSGTNNQFEEIQLDDGIRTLVVGFVPPSGGTAEIVTLRQRLNDMARAGDPGNPSAEAYFANDVPGLIKALRAVIARINSESRPAKGPMGEGGQLDVNDPVGNFNLFQAQYQIFNDDQWKGMLTRYLVSMDAEGNATVTQKWELGKNLIDRRPSRKLVYWNRNGFDDLLFTPQDNVTTEHPQAALMGLDDANLSGYLKSSGKLHPSRAMINWLYGYDFDYNVATNMRVEREYMLSDFGRSGSIVVGPPSTTPTNLPGYNAWAISTSMIKRETRVYAHSNEGILHVLDPLSDNSSQIEQLAIVPPPVMQPYRLAHTKFFIEEESIGSTNMKARWREPGDANTPDRARSVPSYILEGPLVMRDFALSGPSSWSTYVYGMLGKAGNGLYALNVTQPDDPKFLWYRETQYVNTSNGLSPVLISMKAGDSAPTYDLKSGPQFIVGNGSASGVFSPVNAQDYPFYQLGYNSPAAVAGVSALPNISDPNLAFKNFLVLGGGMQEKKDLDNNGYVGAAIYIIDPSTIQNTDAGTLVFNGRAENFYSGDGKRWIAGDSNVGANPRMGMINSRPYLVRSANNRWLTGKIYTADNRGNIFEIEIEGQDSEDTPLYTLAPANWRLRTIASLRMESEKGADDNHSMPHGVLVAGTSQNYGAYVWIAGATANATTKGYDGDENSALIKNKGQYVFAVRASSAHGSARTGGRGTVFRDEMKQLAYDYSSNPSDYHDPSLSTGRGWYIKLKDEQAYSGYREEYATVRPALLGNTVFFGTFTPKEGIIADCAGMVDGYSSLFALDLATGLPSWGIDNPLLKNRHIEIQGVKITGLTQSKQGQTETLFVTYTVTNSALAETDLNKWESTGLIKRVGGLSAFTLTKRTGRNLDIGTLGTYINYWRESY